MKRLKYATVFCLFAFGAIAAELPVEKLKLPPGFRIEVFAANIDSARSLARGAKGTIFVGSHEGNVYALTDADNNGRAEKIRVIAKDLRMPNGVAFKDGALFVAEIHRLLRFDNIEERLDKPGEPVVVWDKFPSDRHHGWKFIAFGPDGLLYVPVGAPCNVCEKPDPYAAISRMKPDGSAAPEVYARGIRNTVGFAWHPQTKELWFTDNGRDMMGDDVPPDELNVAPKAGMHFGFPYCHGGTVKDPAFGAKRACKEFTPPALKFGAHVAALGMRFYTGTMFPPKYQGRIFVAHHGSWNRSSPSGYRVMTAVAKGRKAVDLEPFIEGWLENGKAWGRPVDLMELPDGSLLVSDDEGDAVYRVTYESPGTQNVRPSGTNKAPR